MKKYKVEVKESHVYITDVDAKSEEEAKQLIGEELLGGSREAVTGRSITYDYDFDIKIIE